MKIQNGCNCLRYWRYFWTNSYRFSYRINIIYNISISAKLVKHLQLFEGVSKWRYCMETIQMVNHRPMVRFPQQHWTCGDIMPRYTCSDRLKVRKSLHVTSCIWLISLTFIIGQVQTCIITRIHYWIKTVQNYDNEVLFDVRWQHEPKTLRNDISA